MTAVGPVGRYRRHLLLFVATLAVLLAVAWTGRALSVLADPAAFAAYVRSFGAWAPVAFVVLQATQVVVAPIPGQVTGFAAGYLFGAVAGTVYSMLGLAIGSAVAVVLARRFGRPFVERVVPAATIERFDDVVGRDGLLVFFVAFLVPGFPDDAVCFVAGLTRLPTWKLLVVAVVGRLPTVFLVALAGAEVASNRLVAAAAIAVALAAVAAVVYLRRDALLAALGRP
ncbi:MAG: TVP38/TMEM64 family protein [Halobacteriaceae archaeon]